MDFRDYSEEPGVTNLNRHRRWEGVGGEDGIALFMAMMFLVLLGGFVLLMLENAGTEKQIGGYVKREVATVASAEAGVEQALSWFADPAKAPPSDPPSDQGFFNQGSCSEGMAEYVWKGPFMGIGKGTTTIARSARNDGSCTITVSTENGKGVQVDVGKSPMPKITAAVQVMGEEDGHHIVIHKEFPENVQFVKDDKSALPDAVDFDKIKSFIRRFGRYFSVVDDQGGEGGRGCLKEQGTGTTCKPFHTLFTISKESMDEEKTYNFVLIENKEKFSILPGAYKGYFHFTGDIIIEGVGGGKPSNLPASTEMNLDGLLYTPQKITFGHTSYIHGAVYAGQGFGWEADCQSNSPCLTVRYNSALKDGKYHGVPPMIRLPGTWRTM